MKEQRVVVLNAPQESVPLDHFLLELLDTPKFILVGAGTVDLTSTLIGVVINLQDFIHVVVVVLGALLPSSAAAKYLLPILRFLLLLLFGNRCVVISTSKFHKIDHSHACWRRICYSIVQN